jgi:hypothetical protein
MTNKPGWHLAYERDLRDMRRGLSLGPGLTLKRCPKCARVGLYAGFTRRKDGYHLRFAHVLRFYTTLLGATRLRYEERCIDATPLPAHKVKRLVGQNGAS